MFIIPNLPKTQEEEYKVYPLALCQSASTRNRANAQDFYSTLHAPNKEYIMAARLQASKSRQNK